ncbi:MAG TPA: DNA alkylation repair protein, partial [Clostridiales bacterium]|nr:DNA alkylation repair protein [Clostridiales bacterium]
MTEKDIQKMLFEKQDKEYRDFQAKLIPDENGELKTDSMIGVRTPDLRSLAKALARDPGVSGFLSALPHKYFDENQLH